MEEDIKFIIRDLKAMGYNQHFINQLEKLIKECRDSEDILKETTKENLELKEYIRELEKHIAFYEKHGSYKARIIELQEMEQASRKVIVEQCDYIQNKSIPKSKVKEKIKELKLDIEQKGDYITLGNASQIEALQELMEE